MAERLREVFVVDAVRTPIGRHRGALADVRPDDLGALVIAELIRRTGADPASIDDVQFGCANQAGEDNRNVARMSALLAGLPPSVPGATVNRLCGSGLEAVIDGARAIAVGDAELIVAGGVESMSRAPLVMGKAREAYPRGDVTAYDSTLGWRFVNPRMEAMYGTHPLGETAELVAELYKVSREEQDAFALESQRRWAAAQAAGRFADELCAVELGRQERARAKRFEIDEHPRPVDDRRRARRAGAGVSQGRRDGDGGQLVGDQRRRGGPPAGVGGWRQAARAAAARARRRLGGRRRRAEAHGPRADPGDEEGARAGRDRASAISIWSSSTRRSRRRRSPACASSGFDPTTVNVNGGAIALGHPLGCSGARLVTTLVHELGRRRGRFGLATMCIGVGQGIAAIFERA